MQEITVYTVEKHTDVVASTNFYEFQTLCATHDEAAFIGSRNPLELCPAVKLQRRTAAIELIATERKSKKGQESQPPILEYYAIDPELEEIIQILRIEPLKRREARMARDYHQLLEARDGLNLRILHYNYQNYFKRLWKAICGVKI